MGNESSVRDMLFISHANPEDNEFARWITLQLAREGYPVWCDLTKLLGGEAFWDDIQDAIKNRTIKFLFVSSRTSNSKEGPLQELDCAKGVAKKFKDTLRDFIIPLKIDDLPHDDVHITIHRLTSISFTPSWAKGLAQLLEKLAEQGIPKKPNFGPQAVTEWWRGAVSANEGLLQEPDEHLSNWFPLTMPDDLYCHYVNRKTIGKIDFDTDALPSPAVKDTDLSFLSFAPAGEFQDKIGTEFYIARSDPYRTAEILSGSGPREFPKHLVQLLRMGWDRMMIRRGFMQFKMANDANCYVVKSGMLPNDRLTFQNIDGTSSWRAAIGYRTTAAGKRYWHFGIQAKLHVRPEPLCVIKAHVLFSNDGRTLWNNPRRSLRARRSQCTNWWNDEWRDRLISMMAYLADEGIVRIPIGEAVDVTLPGLPIRFQSDISYVVLKDRKISADEEDEDIDDDFEDDTEEEP